MFASSAPTSQAARSYTHNTALKVDYVGDTCPTNSATLYLCIVFECVVTRCFFLVSFSHVHFTSIVIVVYSGCAVVVYELFTSNVNADTAIERK